MKATTLRRNWLVIWKDKRGIDRSKRYGNHALACRDAEVKGGSVVYSSEVR